MNQRIHNETVSEMLWEVLLKLMDLHILNDFRLVGGTSLSLLLGQVLGID